MGFSNGSAQQILDQEPGIKINEGIRINQEIPLASSLHCYYSGNFEFVCGDSPDQAIILDNSDIFDAIPAEGYFNIFICNDNENSCYDNHASIPVSLN